MLWILFLFLHCQFLRDRVFLCTNLALLSALSLCLPFVRLPPPPSFAFCLLFESQFISIQGINEGRLRREVEVVDGTGRRQHITLRVRWIQPTNVTFAQNESVSAAHLEIHFAPKPIFLSLSSKQANSARRTSTMGLAASNLVEHVGYAVPDSATSVSVARVLHRRKQSMVKTYASSFAYSPVCARVFVASALLLSFSAPPPPSNRPHLPSFETGCSQTSW